MIDPTGLKFFFVQGEGVTDEEFSEFKTMVSDLCEQDNEVGRRMRELRDADADDYFAIIKATTEGGAVALSTNYDDATNGNGTNSLVAINVRGDYDRHLDGKNTDTAIVHEIAGHAWDDYLGTGPLHGTLGHATDLWRSEQNAVAMENLYRVSIGVEQKETYRWRTYDWSMPIYDPSNDSFSILPAHYKTHKSYFELSSWPAAVPWELQTYNEDSNNPNIRMLFKD